MLSNQEYLFIFPADTGRNWRMSAFVRGSHTASAGSSWRLGSRPPEAASEHSQEPASTEAQAVDKSRAPQKFGPLHGARVMSWQMLPPHQRLLGEIRPKQVETRISATRTLRSFRLFLKIGGPWNIVACLLAFLQDHVKRRPPIVDTPPIQRACLGSAPQAALHRLGCLGIPI